LQARLDRKRVPRLKKEYVGSLITTDWVAPDRFRQALGHPGSQPIANPEEQPPFRRMIPALLIVTVVTLFSIAVSNIRFTPATADDTVIAIAMDHRPGAPIRGYPDIEPALDEGVPPRLVVAVDDQIVLDETYDIVSADGAETALAYEQIPIDSGTRRVMVELFDRSGSDAGIVLFDDTIGLDDGEIFNIAINDAPVAAEAEAGRSLYFEGTLGTNAGCRICHSLDPGVVLVGPSFDGIATRAASRVPGLSAEEYLRQSILEPNAYIVDGFPAGQMLQNFGDLLTEDDVNNLVAFLLTLE
jgi:cytochrome c2